MSPTNTSDINNLLHSEAYVIRSIVLFPQISVAIGVVTSNSLGMWVATFAEGVVVLCLCHEGAMAGCHDWVPVWVLVACLHPMVGCRVGDIGAMADCHSWVQIGVPCFGAMLEWLVICCAMAG